jgi:hypothetical protein
MTKEWRRRVTRCDLCVRYEPNTTVSCQHASCKSALKRSDEGSLHSGLLGFCAWCRILQDRQSPETPYSQGTRVITNVKIHYNRTKIDILKIEMFDFHVVFATSLIKETTLRVERTWLLWIIPCPDSDAQEDRRKRLNEDLHTFLYSVLSQQLWWKSESWNRHSTPTGKVWNAEA